VVLRPFPVIAQEGVEHDDQLPHDHGERRHVQKVAQQPPSAVDMACA